jgi:hypothetical protein
MQKGWDINEDPAGNELPIIDLTKFGDQSKYEE